MTIKTLGSSDSAGHLCSVDLCRQTCKDDNHICTPPRTNPKTRQEASDPDWTQLSEPAFVVYNPSDGYIA